MTCDLFLRTYDKDAAWLYHCLRSIKKFATGFNRKIIVTPRASHEAICPIAADFGWEYDVCDTLAADDYVGQQATKMTADQWCTGDMICFVDSDLIFHRPISPDSLVNEDGKIVMLKTRYDKIDTPWQPVTASAVGFPVEWEYMRRIPLAYPRELFALTREHLEAVHGVSFAEFIRRIPNRSFSEFNVLGAIADKFLPEKFHMIDTHSGEEFPQLCAKQFWSWGGITHEVETEIAKLLA